MTEFHPENPLIVQGDHTVLVEVDNPWYAEAREALVRFAGLVKSPEHIHQLFLCEQGYEYRIVTLDSPDELLPEPA